jgi:hypothetical protein
MVNDKNNDKKVPAGMNKTQRQQNDNASGLQQY